MNGAQLETNGAFGWVKMEAIHVLWWATVCGWRDAITDKLMHLACISSEAVQLHQAKLGIIQ